MKKLEEQEIEKILKASRGQETIPESLEPENMKKFLEENTGKNKKKKMFRRWYGMAVAAACLVLLLFVEKNTKILQEKSSEENSESAADSSNGNSKSVTDSSELDKTVGDVSLVPQEYDTSYDELYDFFHKKQKENETYYNSTKGESKQEMAEDSSTGVSKDEAPLQEYADTNKQEAGVDEADCIKNDGRYLYQIMTEEENGMALQITDTKGGLKEVSRIEGFDNIFSFYVWNDTVVILESCWVEASSESALPENTSDVSEYGIDDTWAGYDTSFQKIHIYDITERKNPVEKHVFHIKGGYLDSRITDGYLYCFLNSGVDELQERSNYKSYAPVLEGKTMPASSIYLPEQADSANYLIAVAVDLRHPEKITDAKAVVTSADHVYVTDSDIYVLDNSKDQEADAEGIYSNRTNIIRFYYEEGIFRKEAEGSVKGILLDDMAINESEGYLRMAVTVDSYRKKRIKDDAWNAIIGYERKDEKRDNSLYVLNKDLNIIGKIEGLAENEKIYSARFLKDTGYFVTFRQTDPLFSVDLSEPENPKITGELKISGFSEYLHFYSENLLLGIGMEADEETGRTKGMKLSMFDISNPADVKEQDKYDLSEYNYSECLYDYKQVMIDTDKNLLGFYAEGYEDGYGSNEWKRDYLLFFYENGGFQQKMKIACNTDTKNGTYCRVRGTYIGDIFYLMYGDGRIESYSLLDGSQLEGIGVKTE